jgi:hypothetical protein
MRRSLQAGDHFRNGFPCDVWPRPACLAHPQENRSFSWHPSQISSASPATAMCGDLAQIVAMVQLGLGGHARLPFRHQIHPP